MFCSRRAREHTKGGRDGHQRKEDHGSRGIWGSGICDLSRAAPSKPKRIGCDISEKGRSLDGSGETQKGGSQISKINSRSWKPVCPLVNEARFEGRDPVNTGVS